MGLDVRPLFARTARDGETLATALRAVWDAFGRAAPLVIPGTAADCGAMAPKVEASLMSSHASALRGGRQRNSPTGALP